ncbi:hypothetical protein [Sphingobium sp. RAC03]|uniref:hypothetical protein n=1 Tax=Sphingobium sp. RAC03 TaxID=1843368 RepID=UPI0014958626|nr:hypothetical protein [Sphingobium sp. RAC03]
MTDIVRELRRSKSLKSTKKDFENEKVRFRLEVKREPIDNLPRAISYTLKSFWPSRATYRQPNGKLARQAKPNRIAEPEHAEYLLWLDGCLPQDAVLTIGLTASLQGIKISERRVQ